ncbi:aryl-alcohol dehydrogenase-like predicted oxidoreductase [Breoghania corrubedonensis]|uniref:Aryl-alcohol dehydrogenase-like predicted oxidoreductase n=1 Tax=Breoghania corrubedonensis TaxID=665038 RepID=A0A2T5VH80_9HYPH|nr:aldo/keto reductase [Breoghania corrubedonensis]PTW63121.1 aryl-alcohol dehydrogenase-like predicted oxidoreductase [Breoghania corrubedonensis]
MHYTQLGHTGTFVSRLCLGTMTFGGTLEGTGGIGGLDRMAAGEILGSALNAGINFIDTADVYSGGQSEELLGDLLGARRKDVVLATKANARVGAGPNDVGLSRIHIMDALEGSLKRLKTDYIDLYQIHRWDPLTPIEETLGALDDAVRQGKVRYIGASNLAAWQMMKALGASAQEGLARFVSVQAYYSLAGRGVEDELAPAMSDQGVGMLCWSPLAGGLLSGKVTREGAAADSRRGRRGAANQFPPVDEDRVFDIIDVLREVAGKHDATPAQVALAWLLSRPVVDSVIVGAKRVDQLTDNIGAVDVALEEEDLAALDAVSAEAPRYPNWVLTYNAASRFPKGHPVAGPSWVGGESPLRAE